MKQPLHLYLSIQLSTQLDVEQPVLHGCPTTLVAGTGVASTVSTVTWLSPTATDNSGGFINVFQVCIYIC